MIAGPPDKAFFDRLEGMISAEEAMLLYRLASKLRNGCIVEIGSWRGKSAIAMALGARTQPADKRPMIYCVEPHASYVGVLGGQFGPRDRTAFYRAMLDADCAESVALVNLPSTAAAKGWRTPIGMLFIDGDHSEAGVQADIDAWTPFLTQGGVVAFDDAKDDSIGPAHVIRKILSSGEYRKIKTIGKIVLVQKIRAAEQTGTRLVRRAATEDINSRAETSGYDPEFVLSRLRYGSFVSLPHRYMYIETPKAACTSMKQMIAALEGAKIDNRAAPYHRETRRDMLIHQRRYVDIPTLLDIPARDRENIFSGADGWFVFGLARNPFSRIVSAFENKVRTGEPRYRKLETRYGDTGAYANPKAAFAAFIREIIADTKTRDKDAHFSGQIRMLMPRLIPYTAIFKFENIEAVTAALNTHLAQRGFPHAASLPSRNASATTSWRDYYDDATARIVAEAYAEDFAEFSYDPDDWRGGRDTVEETDAYRRWRAELVERNAFIDRMFDWMDELREP
jgi:predicted O-methyltransferase YrrM